MSVDAERTLQVPNTPVLFYHHCLMDVSTGSSEKLLRDLALILAQTDKFIVHMMFGTRNPIDIPAALAAHRNVRLVPFAYDAVEPVAPCRVFGMVPSLLTVVSSVQPKAFIGLVWSDNQSLIRSLPSDIPLLLISPFGNVSSNGNLRKLYVSGTGQTAALEQRGIEGAEAFFNPLPLPPLNTRKSTARAPGAPIMFGRSGRPDAGTYDPISIQAFARLEAIYGERVGYIYVNPADPARELAQRLKLKQMQFRAWLSDQELAAFYQEIDVFAHARKDGETIGIAIAEAMLAQNPVITHRSTAYNDHLSLLGGNFGWVAETGDVEGYFLGMKHFVDHAEQLHDWGLQAREYVRPIFDRDTISSRFIHHVETVCQYYGVRGQVLPEPPEDHTFAMLKEIFTKAHHGLLDKSDLLHVTAILADHGNPPLAAALFKAWFAGRKASYPETEFPGFAAGCQLEAAGSVSEAVKTWRGALQYA